MAQIPQYNPSRYDHPFGMLMPGRSYSSTAYKYGFNGKEKDDEIKGSGNQQDYGMRIYDPRIARFLSVDPLTNGYPSWSPYPFAMNRPIDGVDLDGEEWKTNHNWTDVISDQNQIKTLTDAKVYSEGMTYKEAWQAYSPIILQQYIDQKKVEDCADMAYSAIIDFAAQFELPIYFQGNQKENIDKVFDNDKLSFKTKDELIENVQAAFSAGDLAADYGVQHTIRKNFMDVKSGDLISWRAGKGLAYHHSQTVEFALFKSQITANLKETSWYKIKWNEFKDNFVEQPKTITGTISVVEGNVSGSGVKAAAARKTYSFDNLKNGVTSSGSKEITRHSEWNFKSFDKKGGN